MNISGKNINDRRFKINLKSDVVYITPNAAGYWIYDLYTDNINSTYCMFYNCKTLSKLVFNSKFNTSKVKDMKCMFENCEGLIELDISRFDTSKVTDMNWMFSKCSSLTSLDLSNFNMINVRNFKCTNLI